MVELRLALLGAPQLMMGEMGVDGRLRSKSRAVVYYLACTGQTHTRSQIGGLLWGEKSENDARNNLRGALTQIRKHLDEYIVADRQTLAFNQARDYWLDIHVFEYDLKRAQKVEDAARRAILRDAVGLYRGDFLEGFDLEIAGEPLYDEWVLPERERLRQLVLAALDQLVAICSDQADYETGIKYAQQLLRLDAWREDAHFNLMEMYALNGQRSLALKQYEICRDVLLKEFGEAPTPATTLLYQQILAMAEGQVSQPLKRLSLKTDEPPFLAPKLIPHFTGRVAELARLRTQLLQTGGRRVYALVGMGGIGKSAIAVETAHALRDLFPDGVLWTHAATDDPKSVAERWANAFGYDFSHIPELAERAAVLRDMLKDKRVLIVFDDVTSSAWVRQFVPDSAWRAVLMTMRDARVAQALRAQVVEVDVLSLADGRSLLADILTEERVAAEEEAAVKIYRLLQGLPLAISLAAQRLAALPRRKLSWLVERLKLETGRLDLEARDKALRASFEISWEGLDETHQRVFAYLAVFGGRDFHVNAMSAVAELDRFPAYDRLDMLVTLSLLNEVGDGRFRQHALLSLFAKEKLGGDDAPFRRMIAYFGDFARVNQENYVALEPEWENLSVSIARAHEMALWTVVLQLTETLQPAWFRRGRYHEARQAFPQAVAAAETLDDQSVLARCLYNWGYVCWEQNDWDEAREKLTASLTLFEKLGDWAGIAKAQLQLGILARDQTDFEEAEQYLAASRRVREELGDQTGIAETIHWQAQLQYSCGNYQTARELFKQSLSLQKAQNDKLGVLRTLRSLARTLRVLGQDLDLAKTHCERASQLADELGDRVERVVIMMDMASIFLQQNDYQKAEELALKSLEMRRKLGDRRGQAMVCYVLSEISVQRRAFQAARQYGEQSLRMCRTLNDQAGIAFSLRQLGDVWAYSDRYQEACEVWREGLETARQIRHETLTVDLQERLKKYQEQEIACAGAPS